MSYRNPTCLRMGMPADFGGKEFRLNSRAVLGIKEAGEICYWNEFYLEAASGETATLVYEGTEYGGEWRLFTLLEPEHPLTAEEAAAKQVGDWLDLAGVQVRVTRVDSSQVYYVEGRPPEGVARGAIAHYFNAENGDTFQVVSWTGDEVEFYNGVTLDVRAVETAFNLSDAVPKKIFRSPMVSGSHSSDHASFAKHLPVIFIFLIIFLFLGLNDFSCSSLIQIKNIPAASPPLTIGATGNWDGKNYHVAAHALVELDEVNQVCQRHEYELTDDYGITSLLTCDDEPGAKNWTLFTRLSPLEPPTPQQAAAQKLGDIVNVDGVIATVTELFHFTARKVEGNPAGDWQKTDACFGYCAQESPHGRLLLVRWNDSDISCYRGDPVAPRDIKAAFPSTSAGQ